jgi:hypothetical protein
MFRKAHHFANDESKLARDLMLSVIFELLCVGTCNYPMSKDVIGFHQQP